MSNHTHETCHGWRGMAPKHKTQKMHHFWHVFRDGGGGELPKHKEHIFIGVFFVVGRRGVGVLGGGKSVDTEKKKKKAGVPCMPCLLLSRAPLACCKGYCGRARRRVGCGAERGTSRGSEVFSLLCNNRLNRSAYLGGDPKRKG